MGRQVKEVRKLQVEKQGQVDSRAVKESLDEITDATNIILKNPMMEGVLIEGIVLTKDEFTDVQHGLGREPRGFLCVRRNDLVDVFEIERTNSSKFLRVAGSFHGTITTAKVSLWIF